MQNLAKQNYPQAAAMTSGYAQTQKIVDLNREASPAEIDAMVLQEAADRLQKAQQNVAIRINKKVEGQRQDLENGGESNQKKKGIDPQDPTIPGKYDE